MKPYAIYETHTVVWFIEADNERDAIAKMKEREPRDFDQFDFNTAPTYRIVEGDEG
jgi:hypothetical protein